MTHGSSRQTFATMRTLPSADGHFAPEPGPQPMTRPASLGGWSSAFQYAAWPSFELWAIMTRGGPGRTCMRQSRRLRLTPLMFGIGASHWVAITCLPVLLFGCTAGSKSLPPYALSDAETTTVDRATTTVE